jgi:peptidoglycan/xylan/chitin deacetylase (PgdA/CDA1 family)
MIRDSFDRVARMPMRRLASGGAILCFHSITTPDAPAEGTAHVSLAAFQSTIGLARRLGELVPLRELVQRHEQGRSTAGLVAVTFDDAYAALLSEVKEFVSREGIPISVFVVTQAAEAGATYWWDRVDDLFPRIAGERWRAFEAACGLPEEYRRRQPAALGPLRPLRQWVLATYAGRWPSHLEPALLALERESGLRTRHRSMTFAEIAELAAIPSVEVGVHTASHPVLPLLSDPDLTREIAAGYAELRSRLATVLPILAVPFGLYDERTLRTARAAGLTACLSVTGGNLAGDAHRYVLPRYCVTRHDTPARLALCLVGVPDRVRRWRGLPLAPYPELPSATS